MFNFQGASSHQILHYLDVHLEDRQINIVVICIGINNILRDSSQSCTDGLWCENIFILGLVHTVRINIAILERNHMTKDLPEI